MPKDDKAPLESDTPTTPDVEAETTSSPDVTEGASSSDAAAEQSDPTFAEHMRAEFEKKYGDPTEVKEGDDPPAGKPEEKGETAEAEAKPPDSEAERKDETANKDDGEDETFRLPDEEFKSLSEKARQRIGHLSTQVAKGKKKLVEANSELEVTRDGHEKNLVLKKFVTDHNIPNDAIVFGFELMRLYAAKDFAGLLTNLKPLLEEAELATGQTLPSELQQKVDDGILSPEDAQALSKARGETAAANANLARMQAERDSARTVNTDVDHSKKLEQAVIARETELKADPDYALIADAVGEQYLALLKTAGKPATVEGAVEMVNTAYELAKKYTVPRPAPVPTPSTPGTSTVERSSTPVAKDLQQHLAQTMESYVPPR